jgi:hypothetical protein
LWKRTNFGIPNEINAVLFPRRGDPGSLATVVIAPMARLDCSDAIKRGRSDRFQVRSVRSSRFASALAGESPAPFNASEFLPSR